MKTVYFEIKHHSDRMAIVKVLQDNGYSASMYENVDSDPGKYFVRVRVDGNMVRDYEQK